MCNESLQISPTVPFGAVTFQFKNRRTKCKEQSTISADDFLIRYLHHVLPGNLTRIRYFGFWSSGNIKKLDQARSAIIAQSSTASCTPSGTTTDSDSGPPMQSSTVLATSATGLRRCPKCDQTNVSLEILERFSRSEVRAGELHTGLAEDCAPRAPNPLLTIGQKPSEAAHFGAFDLPVICVGVESHSVTELVDNDSDLIELDRGAITRGSIRVINSS